MQFNQRQLLPALENGTISAAQLPRLLLPPFLPSPFSLVSSDWPVARGGRPQHGQPPLRLQHIRQSLQYHPGCHHYPGKQGASWPPSCSSPGCLPQFQATHRLPSEQKMGAVITALRPIYSNVIKIKLLFHMEMIFDEFQSSWGIGMGWRDATVCGCLFQGHPDREAVHGQCKGTL